MYGDTYNYIDDSLARYLDNLESDDFNNLFPTSVTATSGGHESQQTTSWNVSQETWAPCSQAVVGRSVDHLETRLPHPSIAQPPQRLWNASFTESAIEADRNVGNSPSYGSWSDHREASRLSGQRDVQMAAERQEHREKARRLQQLPEQQYPSNGTCNYQMQPTNKRKPFVEATATASPTNEQLLRSNSLSTTPLTADNLVRISGMHAVSRPAVANVDRNSRRPTNTTSGRVSEAVGSFYKAPRQSYERSVPFCHVETANGQHVEGMRQPTTLTRYDDWLFGNADRPPEFTDYVRPAIQHLIATNTFPFAPNLFRII